MSSIPQHAPAIAPPPSSEPSSALYFIPRLSPTQERLTRFVAVAAWCYAAYWIYWRWTSSLNWHAPIFSLTLVLAETYGLVSSALLILTVWRINHREPPPARAGRSVDVFITCYDEPLQLLRRTAIGAIAIRYPHRTYLLDDGKRDEVRTMARSLGVGYIRRKGNANAKAGNLNNALKHTRGEFILQLDADHVPLPNILDRMLGYFDDPRVAFVQSPQDFYNTTDSFTHVVNDEGRRLWEENRIFFSLIQPGKDSWNAAFFCGSCGMLRRTALAEIGGFSTLTVTEDMETSIVLHSRGWKSVYHGETLAFGLAPASAGQYHTQRLRWGQGSMQILRKLNPLFRRGLTWRQRLLYFASTVTYLDGLQKLVFYLSPLIFLFTGALPVSVPDHELLVRLIPYLFTQIFAFELLSRGTGWTLISERYNMTKFFTYIAAVSGFFTRRPLRFQVTPKGEGDVPWRTYAPQLALAVLSAAALPFAVVAYRLGWIEYHVSGLASAAFVLNGIWVCWNLYFALFVVRHSVLSRQRRRDYRFLDALPVQVLAGDGNGSAAEYGVAMTNELNASGLSFRASFQLSPETKVRIPLSLSTGTVQTAGTVVRVSQRQTRFGVVYTHGVRFDELPIAARDAIEVHCTHHAVPFWQARYRQSIHLLRHVTERLSDLRVSRRRPVSLPAIVQLVSGTETTAGGTGRTVTALLEEVSDSGARLVLDEPVMPGSPITYQVPGTSLEGKGVVVFNRAFDSPAHVRFAVGICADRCRPAWWRRPFTRTAAAVARPLVAPAPVAVAGPASVSRSMV